VRPEGGGRPAAYARRLAPERPTTKPPTIYLESLDEKGAWASFGSFETKPGATVDVVMALAAAPYTLRLRWEVEEPERSLHWEIRAWV
jgi:hypothetical protein